ncbi:hypothetical protein FAZ15_21155 [Sphingobacterium olei]|uniref:DUF4293 family protein n=1 Tax=Sphingobacterium olei TaxID=2571155 RepID=A0A4U0NBJ2_9SPHI|nr:hypothetical protein [Sphingobacterium olei]TJZ50862.1 hypothetical protein FAZ15_21155 [Sphingobacterium olei]
MYILNKPLAWTGIGISALSTVFCPFLKVPLVGNWNLYQTDTSLFVVTIGVLALSVLVLFIRKVNAFRIVTRVFAAWTVLGFLAVYFKINNYFGMKFLDGVLAKTLHLKWGWFFLFLGALILILSVRKIKVIKEEEK